MISFINPPGEQYFNFCLEPEPAHALHFISIIRGGTFPIFAERQKNMRIIIVRE